jgi:hypothetical protein
VDPSADLLGLMMEFCDDNPQWKLGVTRGSLRSAFAGLWGAAPAQLLRPRFLSKEEQ